LNSDKKQEKIGKCQSAVTPVSAGELFIEQESSKDPTPLRPVQTLITDYERDRLRPHPEMIIRFAQALAITTDELLGLSPTTSQFKEEKPDVKIVKRVKKIQNLPLSQQKALLKTIDTFLKGAEK
jgi:hypothetical protein